MGLEATILAALESPSAELNTLDYAASNGVDHKELVGLVRSLSADGCAAMEQHENVKLELTAEGAATLADGSAEMQLLRLLSSGGPLDVRAVNESHKVGFGSGMKKKWFKKNGAMVEAAVDPAQTADALAELLRGIEAAGGAAAAATEAQQKDLKKRSQIEVVKTVYWVVRRGPSWTAKRVKLETELTKEMLDDDSWADKSFKPVNLNALGVDVPAGYLHPLMQVRTEFRKILLGMGHEEMPTSNWVESSFWNFDALFQPQQHPARDAHDTFFVGKVPDVETPGTSHMALASLESVPPELVAAVRDMHERGGHGSLGYRYDWSLEEARKNLLRTHTTAVTSRMLHALATQEGGFKPAKYFSIDRVFRNETMDATHLAEFHQVEGLVADYDLSLGDLIGVIKEFFTEIGIDDVRFKPAYNPYTEPSLEVFGFMHGLDSWSELGNAGVFRPEMLKPLGLPDGVRVIAFGLALERPTMIKFNVMNIRELSGAKCKLSRTRTCQLPLFKTHK